MYSSNRNNKTFMIITIISIFLVVSLIVVGIILYLKTDIFKSEEELFQRQFLQNIDVINNITDISIEGEYRKKLEENSYNEVTGLNLKYVDNEGKEDNFTGEITGINNKEQNLAFKDIKIDYGTTDVVKMTYLKENNIYGLRFIEGTKFATIDTENDITAVLKYFGIEDIIDSGKIKTVNLADMFTLSYEEIEQLETKYLSIVLQNVIKENYSSKKENVITLSNNQSVTADAYILNLTKQQVETIYDKVLNELINDEIILSKIDNIDNKIKEMGIELNTNIRAFYTEAINKKLKNINIASDIVLTVYEVEGNTVKTTIEYANQAIEFDIINQNEINIKYLQLISENLQETTISIKKEQDTLKVGYQDYNNKKIEFIRNLTINDNEIQSVINLKYSDNNIIKELDVSLDKKITIGLANEIPTSFEESGKVLLNDYDEKSTHTNLEALKKRIIKLIREKRDETESVLLDYIVQYNNKLEENEKTEEEKKRKKFNSKFEVYEGENLEKSIVLNMIDEAGKNILNYQVIGNDQIKIYIEEGKENKELTEEIKSKLEQLEENSYNITIGYDKNAKVNQVALKVVSD